MQKPAIPLDEDQRLNTLNSLGLLDTPPDERFDRFTLIAQRLFNVPIALVSLVDYNRQWFKSCQGLSVSETTRDISFCGHAIHESQPLVIENALADRRFADNPLVVNDPKIRFYAGYPVRAPNGKKIGTLCVIDYSARKFSPEDRQLLIALGELLENEVRVLNEQVIDHLTGLANQRGFINSAERLLKMYQDKQTPMAIVYLDIDQFQSINSKLGHTVGDKLLLEFSELVLQAFHHAPSIARLDDDNFAVLVSHAMLERIHQPMQQLIEAVAIRNKVLQRGYPLSFSMGLTKFNTSQHQDIEQLITAARAAMLVNKQTKAV